MYQEIKDISTFILERLKNTDRKNFKVLLEHFGYFLEIDEQIPLYTTNEIKAVFLPELANLRESKIWKEDLLFDPLTDLGIELGILHLQISNHDAIEYAESIEEPERLPFLILDEHCGSGRKMLACYARFREKAVYAGTEKNQYLHRIAIINMHLRNIHAHILHVSHGYLHPDKYPTDWGWANQFVVPKIAVLEQRETRLERREWSDY